MTANVTHAFVSGIADDAAAAAAGEILPSHWNASHDVTIVPEDISSVTSAKVLGRTSANTGACEQLATTGTGSVVLSVAPTITGHPTIEGVTATGATGSGKMVFDTSPVLVTPALGTPASGALTNCTGPWAMERIAKVVTTSSQATVDFSSIPATYSVLRLLWQAQDTASGTAGNTIRLKVNNDGTAANYTSTGRAAVLNASALVTSTASSVKGVQVGYMANSGNTGVAGSGVLEIVNYAGTTFHKGINCWWGNDEATNNIFIAQGYARWKSTAAITQLTILTDGTAFTDGSTFILYGVK